MYSVIIQQATIISPGKVRLVGKTSIDGKFLKFQVNTLKDLEEEILKTVDKTYTIAKYNIEIAVKDRNYPIESKILKNKDDLKLIDKKPLKFVIIVSEKKFENISKNYKK